jgi:serine/threonine protein kinase
VLTEAMDMVRRLMVVDPNLRMTVDEALRHPWILQNIVELDELYQTRVGGTSIIDRLYSEDFDKENNTNARMKSIRSRKRTVDEFASVQDV